MRETGRILKINDNRATVEMDFKGGCKNCGASGMCTSKGPGKRELNLSVNDATLKAGDWIEIETRPRSLLTAAFLVFILPLLLAFIAYFIAHTQGAGEGTGLLIFFLAFGLAEGVIALLDRWIGRHRFFEPEIIKPIS
ncbi:SoxR reducing system RseC family protein [bacterium]|nr:SoxR reducing system RseC family protein [bacterium]